jgi:protein-disulfide isomerase|tara:strand:+ start:1387 stop:1983 length:597 start_codon:yes stop_codon:yes gene_type:complete
MKKIIKKFINIVFFLAIITPASAIENKILKIGNNKAKITVKVFSSLTCPHCANFHNKIFKNLKLEYIDEKKVKFEHHSFPLDLAALNAEKILRCTENIDTSFNLLSEIYLKQEEWAVGSDIKKINESIIKIGTKFNLSKKAMNKCLENEKIQEQILTERIDAQKKYKISSTPTIYINEKKYEGKHEFKNFKKQIDKLL